ncbi:MAG: hypothetical protein HS110_17885 [Zoogloeaceae bacterium]|nr:hypothetical protein [Zoogloeaceae bacterium]MCK6384467.1 hypothetical protein [Rhodocyclaceae bacterium]
MRPKPPLAAVLAAFLAACAALLALPASAEDTALLIQIEPSGRYTVWHAGGKSPLGEEEISALEVTARPEGGKPTLTTAGLVQAFDTDKGMLIRLPALGPEKTLLIDRDGCGGIKIWHAQGDVNLTEDELTEIVLSALPEGGKNVALSRYHAKAYSTRIGVIAAIWKPVAKPVR